MMDLLMGMANLIVVVVSIAWIKHLLHCLLVSSKAERALNRNSGAFVSHGMMGDGKGNIVGTKSIKNDSMRQL